MGTIGSVGAVRIGISGWRYAGWRSVFYPKGLPHRRELECASRAFESVEINGSFYSLQRPELYREWYRQTPDGFVFAVKGSRFITHMKKLRDVATPLANFFASGVLALGDKLGPFLWQLPPTFRFDGSTEDRLARFFDRLPRDSVAAAALARRHDRRVSHRSWLRPGARRPLRHALEIRHESFRTPRFLRLLRSHDIGLVVADTAGRWPLLEEVTADFVYVRLHGDEELYVSGYTPQALDAWARRIRRWRRRRDVYVYFDNDAKVHAPFDAMALAARVAGRRDAPRLDPGHGGDPARTIWPEIGRKRPPGRRFSGPARDAIGARSRA